MNVFDDDLEAYDDKDDENLSEDEWTVSALSPQGDTSLFRGYNSWDTK